MRIAAASSKAIGDNDQPLVCIRIRILADIDFPALAILSLLLMIQY